MEMVRKCYCIGNCACVVRGGDDNDSSPTTVGITSLTANVSGRWLFTGAKTKNTCTFLSDDQLSSSATETIDVSQNNTTVNAQHVSGTIFGSPHTSNGSISGNTLTLSLADPINSTSGACSYSIGGTLGNTLTSETTGDGTINLNVASIGGNCSAFGTLPCAVTFTGTWQKIGSGATDGATIPTVQPTATSESNPTPTPQPTSAPQASTPTPVPQSTPEPQPTATPIPQPTATPSGIPSDCTSDIYNCSDFSTQADAQAVYDRCFPYNGDIHRLDGSPHDGLACNSLLNKLFP